jgi:beta-glucosidase
MTGRTYRYFKGDPLWPFGYGLSYSKFEHSAPRTRGNTVTVQVKNTSTREGDDVVQLYLKGELIGFQRVHLKPAESRPVLFPKPATPGALKVR